VVSDVSLNGVLDAVRAQRDLIEGQGAMRRAVVVRRFKLTTATASREWRRAGVTS